MIFPFKYTGEVLIHKAEPFDSSSYIQNLKETVDTSINPLNKKIEQIFPLPYINLSLRYSFQFNEDHATLNAIYTIALFELNIFFILSFGLSIFLFVTQVYSLAILFCMVAFGYYWFALSKVSKGIRSMLLQNHTMSNPMEEHGLWRKQQEWLKNENLCPACGEPKNPYASKCINCGILVNKQAKIKDKNFTPTVNDQDINYQYKKDKDA